MSLCLPTLPNTLKRQKEKTKFKYLQHIWQKYRTSILDKIQANTVHQILTLDFYLKDPRKINNRSEASLLVRGIRHISQSFALGAQGETDWAFPLFPLVAFSRRKGSTEGAKELPTRSPREPWADTYTTTLQCPWKVHSVG